MPSSDVGRVDNRLFVLGAEHAVVVPVVAVGVQLSSSSASGCGVTGTAGSGVATRGAGLGGAAATVGFGVMARLMSARVGASPLLNCSPNVLRTMPGFSRSASRTFRASCTILLVRPMSVTLRGKSFSFGIFEDCPPECFAISPRCCAASYSSASLHCACASISKASACALWQAAMISACASCALCQPRRDPRGVVGHGGVLDHVEHFGRGRRSGERGSGLRNHPGQAVDWRGCRQCSK